MKSLTKYGVIILAVLANFVPLSFLGTSVASAESMICPLAGRPATLSPYGPRNGGFHHGIDLDADTGTAIYADQSGDVTAPPFDDGGYGVWLVLAADNGAYTFRFGHLGQIVKTGHVNAGDVIAYSATSGDATGPHLHWEVRNPADDIDPAPFWNQGNPQSCSQPGTNSVTSPNPTSPPPVSTINPTGGDCHNYTLQYDTSRSYPCVTHLQNDLGISADGVFGNDTKQAVINIEQKKGFTADGIVHPSPGSWCAIHGDLPGCPVVSSPPPVSPPPVTSSPPPVTSPPPPAQAHDPIGFVDVLNCQHISGWFDDADNKQASIDVHIYIDGQGTNTGATPIYRPDVNSSPAYNIGSGNHGFDWTVPNQWHDGRQHGVTVFGINIGGGNNYGIDGTLGPCASSSSGGQLANGYNGLCLDVPAGNFSDSVLTQLYSCNQTAAQKWTFNSNGSIQTGNNKCLDVQDGNTSNGRRVQIYSCLGNANQQWQRYPDQSIRPSINTSKCLDDYGFGTSNSTPVVLWDCNGGSNQKWQ